MRIRDSRYRNNMHIAPIDVENTVVAAGRHLQAVTAVLPEDSKKNGENTLKSEEEK